MLVWLGSSGCLTWQSANEAPALIVERERPESVRVTLVDGNVMVLSSPTVTNRAVVSTGEGPEAPLAEIRTLEVRRFHVARTLGLGALIAGFALAWIAAFADDQEGSVIIPGPEPK